MRYREIIAENKTNTGLYVAAYYDEESNHALEELQKSLDLKNPSDSDDFHSTIVYSKTPIYWRPDHGPIGHEATPTGWTVFPSKGGTKHALVLLLSSAFLETRFKLAMARGASYDYDEYRPHITMSYDVGPDFDVEALPVPEISLVLDCERSEPLDD